MIGGDSLNFAFTGKWIGGVMAMGVWENRLDLYEAHAVKN